MDTVRTYVWPTLRARNARALIDFLVLAFGFLEVVAYDNDGVIGHAELAWPEGGGVMIGAVREGDDHWTIAPGSAGIYIVAGDPDGLFERAIASGAKVIIEPRHTEYGSREFVVCDLEGNRWSFGSYAGAPLAT